MKNSTPDAEAYTEFSQSVTGRWSAQPDGRPSELYLVKGGWFKAEILVDKKTNEVYCSIAPILSMRGWELDRVKKWCENKGWVLEHLGPGTKIDKLKST